MKVYRARGNKNPYPIFATEQSACFDLSVSLREKSTIKVFSSTNREQEIPVRKAENGDLIVKIPSRYRAMIPTGLHFDIPEKHVLKVYPRSGFSFKTGMNLINGVGIIDADYVEEVFILMFNTSETPVFVKNGMRIAQGLLEPTLDYQIEASKAKPKQKTSREGGIGSTGG